MIPGEYEAVLPYFILGKYQSLKAGHLVGGVAPDKRRSTAKLPALSHGLSATWIKTQVGWALLVKVGLFDNLNTPTYGIIAALHREWRRAASGEIRLNCR